MRRESTTTGERGYSCYLLGMAPQLLQPLASLTIRQKQKTKKRLQLVSLCYVEIHKAEK